MFTLMMSRSSSDMGHVGSECRSLGQVKEKPCQHSRGHSFDLIFIKLHKNVCLDDVMDMFESGSHGVKM